MFSGFLARSELLVWPLVGLGIFFVTFVIVLIRVAFGMRDATTARVAALPLEEDSPAVPKGGAA